MPILTNYPAAILCPYFPGGYVRGARLKVHTRNKAPAGVKTWPRRHGRGTPPLIYLRRRVWPGKSHPAAGSRASAAECRRFCATARCTARRDTAWERPSAAVRERR